MWSFLMRSDTAQDPGEHILMPMHGTAGNLLTPQEECAISDGVFPTSRALVDCELKAMFEGVAAHEGHAA